MRDRAQKKLYAHKKENNHLVERKSFPLSFSVWKKVYVCGCRRFIAFGMLVTGLVELNAFKTTTKPMVAAIIAHRESRKKRKEKNESRFRLL